MESGTAAVRGACRRGFKRVRRVVRGEAARDVEDTLLQRTATEVVLADRGYSRTDVYGVDRDVVTLTQRFDVGASLRRVCAACGRGRAVKVLSVVGAAASVVAAHTASYAVGVVAALALVAAVAAYAAPGWVFDAPGPRWSVGNVQGGGLSDEDVALRMAIMAERDEYREELTEQKRKEAERKAKSGGRNPFKPRR